MDTIPEISRAPSLKDDFGDSPSGEAVNIAPVASGYPLINVLFTFDPRDFPHTLRGVSQTDKETYMTFYETHKGEPVYWLNKQDDITYEVIFLERPICKLDGRKDLWRIEIKLRQNSSYEG